MLRKSENYDTGNREGLRGRGLARGLVGWIGLGWKGRHKGGNIDMGGGWSEQPPELFVMIWGFDRNDGTAESHLRIFSSSPTWGLPHLSMEYIILFFHFMRYPWFFFYIPEAYILSWEC